MRNEQVQRVPVVRAVVVCIRLQVVMLPVVAELSAARCITLSVGGELNVERRRTAALQKDGTGIASQNKNQSRQSGTRRW